MKTPKVSKVSVLAFAASLAVASSAGAQQQTTIQPLPSETAMQYATRINACAGANVVSAEFDQTGRILNVQCPRVAVTDPNGMAGGLGTGGLAAAGGGLLLVAIALAGGGGGSSGATTTTTGTTGTN